MWKICFQLLEPLFDASQEALARSRNQKYNRDSKPGTPIWNKNTQQFILTTMPNAYTENS